MENENLSLSTESYLKPLARALFDEIGINVILTVIPILFFVQTNEGIPSTSAWDTFVLVL